MIEVSIHLQKHFLHDVGRIHILIQQPIDQAVDRIFIAVQQLFKCIGFALAQTFHQQRILKHLR